MVSSIAIYWFGEKYMIEYFNLTNSWDPNSNGTEAVLHIPRSSRTRALPSNLVSYRGHSLGEGFYPSVEMCSVYFRTTATNAKDE